MPQCGPRARRNTGEIAQKESRMLSPWRDSLCIQQDFFDEPLWFWSSLFATCCLPERPEMVKVVPKWCPNLSKTDPGRGLEATWESTLKQDASKTSFLMVFAPFWDALGGQFGCILSTIFCSFFEMAPGRRFHRSGPHLGSIWGLFLKRFLNLFLKLFPKCEMHENHNIHYGLAMSETFKNSLFRLLSGSFFWCFWTALL